MRCQSPFGGKLLSGSNITRFNGVAYMAVNLLIQWLFGGSIQRNGKQDFPFFHLTWLKNINLDIEIISVIIIIGKKTKEVNQ